MSMTSLNFHNVAEATARLQCVNTSKWLTLEFRDSTGDVLEVTLFSDSPEKLLEAIAAVSRPEQANATLFVAAADLLAAATEAEGFCSGFFDDETQEPIITELLAKLRAALTKAGSTS